jgi:hypothetical protein
MECGTHHILSVVEYGKQRVALNEENQPVAEFHYLPFGSLLPDNGNVPEALRKLSERCFSLFLREKQSG